jgi:hypothetical protein
LYVEGLGDDVVFIGLDKRKQANFTQWANGKPLTYFDFDSIDGPTYQHCVATTYVLEVNRAWENY